ncbi:hypothetical protein [Paraglaciecola sp.]|uniref:hypothetical protein n=1 Tax=Paraglaciecola sp. TaxID=1920173 RepID=UPI003EFAB1BB
MKKHRYRGLESCSFMMMIEGAVEYFKSILNRHLSTDNYEYICTILDSIPSRKKSLNSTDALRIEGIIYELCGSSTSFELKNKDVFSLFDSNKSKDINVLRVSYS